jgi:hypothetical protein
MIDRLICCFFERNTFTVLKSTKPLFDQFRKLTFFIAFFDLCGRDFSQLATFMTLQRTILDGLTGIWLTGMVAMGGYIPFGPVMVGR